MAKRGKNKRSRRRNTAINLLNIGEAYAQTAIVTDVAFGLSPYNFLMSKESPSGASTVTLKELLGKFNTVHAGTPFTEGEWVWENVKNGWFGGLWKTVAVGVGFRVAKKILAKPRRQINAGLKAAQLNTMIKV